VSQYQKGKADLDFTEAIDSEWQWHQLDRLVYGLASVLPTPVVIKHWREGKSTDTGKMKKSDG